MLRSAVVIASFILLILALPARGQTPSPLQVEADQIIFDQNTQVVDAEGSVRLRYRGLRLTADRARFDLRAERLQAEGRVILIDESGRELRGRRISYDVRLQQAEVESAQAIVDRVYLRSSSLQAQPNRVVAEDAVLTTCDPANPGYRITARQVEVIPGERLVARDATLWIGNRRLISLPTYTLSLRTPEETARSFPRAGYNHVDGLWADYPLTYRLGPVQGLLRTKYGWNTGFLPLNILTYPGRIYAASLTVGRNQNEDMLVFEQAEAALDIPSRPLAVGVRHGWFREPSTGLEAVRSAYEVRFAPPSLAIGPRTSLAAAVGYRDAYYGTGHRYIVSRADVALVRMTTPTSSVALRYQRLVAEGTTPFLFDAVDPEDVVNTVVLEYGRTVPRGPGVTASYSVGASYDFLDGTPSVRVGTGRRRPGAYHWGVGTSYNLTTHEVTLTVDTGTALGGTYVTLQSAYFIQAAQFDYLDLIIRSRLCGCFDLSLVYRSVQREFWLEIALAPDVRPAFPEEVPPP